MSQAEATPSGLPDAHAHAREFITTQWSVVLRAGDARSQDSSRALEDLCGTYWYPLYAYIRRQGRSPDDAQDLTQDFFARLIQNNSLRLANPDRGRFRTFLLSSLKNFLVTEWEKSRALKRGGAHSFFSLDERDAEGRYRAEPVDGLTPERIYEKRWAVTVLENVLAHLQSDYERDGKSALFDALKPHVWSDRIVDGYESLAVQLGITEGALRVAMHRLRESFRERLRSEVAQTVSSPAEVDAELRDLISALRG